METSENHFGIAETNLDWRKAIWNCQNQSRKELWKCENHFGIAGNHFVIEEKHSGLPKNFRHPHVFTYHGIF